MTATLRYKLSTFSSLIAIVAASTAAAAADPIVALAFGSDANAIFIAQARALYRGDDAGRHWTNIALPAGVQGGAIAAVAAPAKRESVLYLAGPGFGVWRSSGDGRNWVARNDGLPSRNVAALATHADQPDTLYAYIPGEGVFRSEDAGTHWKWMDNGPRGGISRFIHSNMPGSMQTGWLFAATAKGVGRSMDCFCLWQNAGELGAPVDAIVYDPREPRHVYAATPDGFFLSADGGEQWTHLSAPAARVTALAVSPAGVVFAGTADGGLYRRSDQAKSWERVSA